MLIGSFEHVDDLLGEVYRQLLCGEGNFNVESTKGKSTEHLGALLTLENPRARLSRSVERARIFSAVGEFLWYVSGSNAIPQIEYYLKGYSEFSDDGLIANGAYGPRIFGNLSESSGRACSLWDAAISNLRKGSGGTRNAVIPILRWEDLLKPTNDRPCTCTMQFFIRDGKLVMHCHMRSNDAYIGLPHDLFSFTMLQELAARQIGVDVGPYLHSVSSLHLYDDESGVDGVKSTSNAKRYLEEGLYEVKPMREMPKEDPWDALKIVIQAEENIRNGDNCLESLDGLPDYWCDMVTLLRAYSATELLYGNERRKKLDECLAKLNDPALQLYILDRIQTLT